MRKLSFVEIPDVIRKLTIYESDEGVYLFGYNCLQDASAIWDNWYENIAIADEFCEKIYGVKKDDWIIISDPCVGCQHDFISQVRVKGRTIINPEWGKFETLVNNKWVDFTTFQNYLSFDGMTGNERLFVTGLMDEFYKAKKVDKVKARKILLALDFDIESISRIV